MKGVDFKDIPGHIWTDQAGTSVKYVGLARMLGQAECFVVFGTSNIRGGYETPLIILTKKEFIERYTYKGVDYSERGYDV